MSNAHSRTNGDRRTAVKAANTVMVGALVGTGKEDRALSQWARTRLFCLY